ncbi:MAG: putative 2-dehydropantoate 2-reductase [Nostoc sp. DedSLP03]|uniref:putative 2-dehydropantoate 2-reductase n=1 Tax=Nostoc sp. DedSLP03 TaxID=3075400 RepID=UPI002AD2972C|nr:putative 2-dehydropantoate 2-reductase [Nostoc sp. DedSLP03]MDZ7965828.1 putative 2-dehydropantoate 2-reductase [Nostoc sp. DedSLP03]
MPNRSYAILGTGALGGYYGACLQRGGLDVHFLLHSDYEYVSKHGLVVESIDGDFTLPHVNAYNDVSEMPLCDVVAITLKTTQNHLLPHLLPAVVKEGGVVLLLQNGLGIEEEVIRIVGPQQQIIGGLCFLCSNKVGPGHIRHLDYKEIKLGEYAPNYRPCGVTEQMCQIATDFERADIPIRMVDNLLQARWEKLVWNIPYSGLPVVLNATTDELMADLHTRSLIKQLMSEVVKGARSCACTISDDFIHYLLEHTDKMKPYRTSMKIDYDEHRPLEVEAIFGNPLLKAQEAGANLTQLTMLYQQIKFLDAKNCGCVAKNY